MNVTKSKYILLGLLGYQTTLNYFKTYYLNFHGNNYQALHENEFSSFNLAIWGETGFVV